MSKLIRWATLNGKQVVYFTPGENPNTDPDFKKHGPWVISMTQDDDLPKPEPKKAFDGETYSAARDYLRLDGQLGRVYDLMKDGKWRTLESIASKAEGSEAAVSARLRDLRKEKYGNLNVERRHIANGLWEYRLVLGGGDGSRSSPDRVPECIRETGV